MLTERNECHVKNFQFGCIDIFRQVLPKWFLICKKKKRKLCLFKLN